MRIALASAPVKNRDIAYNMDTIQNTMKACSGTADMVLFGESFLQGFDCLTWDYAADSSVAVSVDGPHIAQIRKAAREYAVAVGFGYIERVGDTLFSSYLLLDMQGNTIQNFHRVSPGWKEYWRTDHHYQEGEHFEAFSYLGKRLAVGLCGDLWTEGRPEELKALGADAVLWPVWTDFQADQWNEGEKYAYAEQAALCGERVLYINPFCTHGDAADAASGGAADFQTGDIAKELPAGEAGILMVEL